MSEALLGVLKKDKISDKVINGIPEIVKLDDSKKIIEETEKKAKEYVDSKLLTEDQSVKFILITFSIVIRKASDKKDDKIIKEVKAKFDEYIKKYPNVAKEVSDETNNISKEIDAELEKEQKEKQTKQAEAIKKLHTVYEPKSAEIKKIFDAAHTSLSQEQMVSLVDKYCTDNKIEDGNIYYGLFLIKLGYILSGDKAEGYKTNILNAIK